MIVRPHPPPIPHYLTHFVVSSLYPLPRDIRPRTGKRFPDVPTAAAGLGTGPGKGPTSLEPSLPPPARLKLLPSVGLFFVKFFAGQRGASAQHRRQSRGFSFVPRLL